MAVNMQHQRIEQSDIRSFIDFFTLDFHSKQAKTSIFFHAKDYGAQDYEAIDAACCQLVNAINNAKKVR